jgi:hypothetical protein
MIYILLCVSSLVAEDNGKLVNGDQENPVVLGQDLSTIENRQGVVSLLDGKFIVNTPDSKRIYAIQCGLDVTIFTLKYFNVNYSFPKVSMELPLSNSGISMKDIKSILQCYGLVTDARQNITLKKIIQKIDYGTLAILPMQMGNGVNHYFIIMLNNDKKPILVNVSKGVSVLNASQSEKEVTKYNKLFADAGGVVLFVKKGKDKTVSISKTVKLNPDTIELGEFMIGGPESSSLINASFNLINTSDLPIMVSSVQTSCGCTKLEWDGGILKACEKKEIKFSVIPGVWGRGEQVFYRKIDIYFFHVRFIKISDNGNSNLSQWL